MYGSLFVYVVAIILGVVLAIFDVPFMISIVAIFIVILFGSLVPLLNALIWTKDIRVTERFLRKKQKNALFRFYLAIAEKNNQEVESSLDEVLKKHKQPGQQAVYQTIYALSQNNLLTAKEHIPFIQPPEYQTYYQAYILIEENQLNEAEELAKTISNLGMHYTILAEIENKRENTELAKSYVKKALEHSRGLNKFTVYKAFERENLVTN